MQIKFRYLGPRIFCDVEHAPFLDDGFVVVVTSNARSLFCTFLSFFFAFFFSLFFSLFYLYFFACSFVCTFFCTFFVLLRFVGRLMQTLGRDLREHHVPQELPQVPGQVPARSRRVYASAVSPRAPSGAQEVTAGVRVSHQTRLVRTAVLLYCGTHSGYVLLVLYWLTLLARNNRISIVKGVCGLNGNWNNCCVLFILLYDKKTLHEPYYRTSQVGTGTREDTFFCSSYIHLRF